MSLQRFPMQMNLKESIGNKNDEALFLLQLSRNDFYTLSKEFSFLLIEIMGQAAELTFQKGTDNKKNYLVAINEFFLYEPNIENMYEKCCVQVKILEKWCEMCKTDVKVFCGTTIIAKCICIHCH